MKIKDVHFYGDIIDLPHHISSKHTPMKISDRAAQFGSFAALTGHSAAVAETARFTNEKHELSEYVIEILDLKLQVIRDRLCDKPLITLEFFKPDELKSGGEYITHTGNVCKIDEYEKLIYFSDGLAVPINMISDIESDVFADSFYNL